MRLQKNIWTGLTAVLVPCAFILFYYLKTNRKTLKDSNEGIIGQKPSNLKTAKPNTTVKAPKIRVLYATCTGTARNFAKSLSNKLASCKSGFEVEVNDLATFEEAWLEKGGLVLFVLSTWTDGKLPETAQPFMEWINDLVYDFRVSKDHLAKLQFAIFGLGGKIYDGNYCKAAHELNGYLSEMGANALMPPAYGDDATTLEQKFDSWSSNITRRIESLRVLEDETNPGTSYFQLTDSRTVQNAPKPGTKRVVVAAQIRKQAASKNSDKSNDKSNSNSAKSESTSSCCGGSGGKSNKDNNSSSTGCCKDNSHESASKTVVFEQGDHLGLPADDCCGSDDEDDGGFEEEDKINMNYVTMDMEESDDEKDDKKKQVSVGGCGNGDEAEIDLEDLGAVMKPNSNAGVASKHLNGDGTAREMVTKLQRKALTKEGYKIIGSHSAVKLCRWTKNQMRGRGGCYKHTFYGITSYQCMEATPSLACANKCVFCWRHHKNPVGTDWRWKTDEPARIVQEAVELHQAMIYEMKGIPGVLPERLIEGNKVRHCALSLVGEPIMYPRINEMMKELHMRDISTFMVTNAQFPDKVRELDPVTQLYVSIDASTKDSLKAIDRPLFKDFWERYLSSLRHIALKKQRTVFRMTLVKDWNMNEAENYAELIELGLPDFIEIKAMTYCGKSDASSLTMQNVPWHKEVCSYSEGLCQVLKARGIAPIYSIATEHEHSCCILLAREDKFKVDGVWNTWINYPKFHALMRNYYETGENFTSEDYMAPTPHWALYHSEERGFDPVENRWKRNKTGALVEIEYKSSESGCG